MPAFSEHVPGRRGHTMPHSHWNRSARRSGGTRSARIDVPTLSPDALIIIAQRERIRKKFGEEGVRRFDEALLAQAGAEETP